MGFLIITNCVVSMVSMVILHSYFLKEDEVAFLKKIVSEKNKTIEDLQLELKDIRLYETLLSFKEGVSSK